MINYENYINENYEMPTEAMTKFTEWKKTPEMDKEVSAILHENHIDNETVFFTVLVEYG